MDLREVFAANLRRLRNAKGVSQDELAHEANVSRSYLSQLEKGTFYASLNIVGRLRPGVSRGQALAQLVAWDSRQVEERSGERPTRLLVRAEVEGLKVKTEQGLLPFPGK